MSNFTVSARKYRPGTFDTVIGQEHITQTLKNAIRKDHLGHAFLFCGPRGVGKTTCARILAKALNCSNLTTDYEPCGQCDACLAFQSQQSFNIYELDAASNNSVEDIRSLNDQVRFAPQSGRYKIYIIDEVHMLSTAAFNAFLKTLEEPPSYAIFILATTEKHKILPTILSRCQVFDFHRIGIKEAIGQLKSICEKEHIEAEEEALYVIAQKADGALRDALSIFDRIVSYSGEKITYRDVIKNLNVLDYDYYFKTIDLVWQQNLPGLMLLFDDILNKGFDGHNFLVGLSEHLRNLLVCRNASTIKLLDLSEGTQQRYLEQAKRSELSFLLSGLNILNQFDINYKSSKNQRLHVELALMKLCYLPDVLQLEKLPDSQADLKKKPSPERIETQPSESVQIVAEPQPVASAIVSAVKEPVRNLATGSLKNLNSIKEKIRSHSEAVKTVVEPSEEKLPVADDITLEKFMEIWEGYLADLYPRKGYLASGLKDTQIERTGKGFTITLLNDSWRLQLEADRMNFQDFMLANYSFTVPVQYVFQPVQEGEKKYIFTDEDRFEKMAESYPLLKELQRRFGLRL
jgi:DNA polymerase-3 subunit gamma/tau